MANRFADGVKNVLIGFVKPNLGHGKGDFAMASIIKTVLCPENRTILPNIKFDSLYPRPISAAIEVYSRTYVDGVILDMARTLRVELDMHFVTLELDKLDRDAASAVLHVLRKS